MPEQQKRFMRTIITHTIAAGFGAWLAGRRRDAIISADSDLEEAHSTVDDVETTMLLFFGVCAALTAELDEPVPFIRVESTEEIMNGIERGIPPSTASRLFLQRVPDIVHRIRSGISAPWTLIPRSASAKVLEACTGFLDHSRQLKRQSVGYTPLSDSEKMEALEALGGVLDKWTREKKPTPAIYLLSHLMSVLRA